MALLRLFNVAAAMRDLRGFLAARRRHELVFAVLAVGITTLLIAGFYHDSNLKKPWKRDVQYVESWPLDRTEAQILAKQKIDLEKRNIEEAKLEKLRAERRAEFKKVDDALNRLGI